MVIPPVSSYQGNSHNKEVTKILEEKEKEDSPEDCKNSDMKRYQEEKNNQKETSKKNERDVEMKLPDNLLGSLTIRKINAEYAIVEGAGKEELAYYIGHLPETAAIGAIGNCVLAGHNGGKNGTFFKHLDKLQEGDMVEVTDLVGKNYVYTVMEVYITDAYDKTVKNQGAKNMLTLLTCSDNGKKRLIVTCIKER